MPYVRTKSSPISPPNPLPKFSFTVKARGEDAKARGFEGGQNITFCIICRDAFAETPDEHKAQVHSDPAQTWERAVALFEHAKKEHQEFLEWKAEKEKQQRENSDLGDSAPDVDTDPPNAERG